VTAQLGVILQPFTTPTPTDARLRALDAWIARTGRAPDLLPVWAARSPHDRERWPLDRRLLDRIAEAGIRVIAYVESTGLRYADITDGKHDAAIARLGCHAEGLDVRFDQEADGTGLKAQWQTPEGRELYAETFAHVAEILHQYGCRMIWSPVQPQRAFDMGLYPGPDAVDVMGFTNFTRSEEAKLPSRRWARYEAECRTLAPDKPVMVTECGIEVGVPRRPAYIRDLANVTVDAACVFDMPVPNGDRWEWSKGMDGAWAGL
jgi:hypothetical protein